MERYLSHNLSYTTCGKLINRRGAEVGSYTKKYGRLCTKWGELSVHRVLWYLHYGAWPLGELDHIDGDTHNNSLSNLRDCTRAHNAKNRRAYASNTAGYKGVYPGVYKGNISSYGAKIQNEGCTDYLGSYKTPEEAAKAYDERCLELHGDFADINFKEEI